jgi:exportin-1
MLEDVPRIFEAVFQCTLEVVTQILLFVTDCNHFVLRFYCSFLSCQMITKNFEDYPEHRLKFFSLLRAIGTHCFKALIQLSSQVCICFQIIIH